MANLFRDLYNAARGRTEITDRELKIDDDLGELRELLIDTPSLRERRERNIPEPVVKMVYSSDGEVWKLESAPIWILTFLKTKFKPEDGTYVTATDRAYSEVKTEMHYVNVEKGIVEGKINEEPLRNET
jgi:hypothetical protein